MPESSAPSLRAGRHLPAILLFAGLTVVVIAADLVTKWLAFEHVAQVPLHLSRDPDDGSTIVQQRHPDGSLTPLNRDDGQSPASAIPNHPGVTVVPGVFSLRLTINQGAVFGVGKGKQVFFAVVSVIAMIAIPIFFYRSDARARWLHVCLALILGGAAGNFYDRIRFNGVRDMCYLFPGVKLPFGLSWPGGNREVYPWIFNIADAALVVGVILGLIISWHADRHRPADSRRPG
jgi:signal peptidase II